MERSSSLEMETLIRVQILIMAISISYCAYTTGNGIQPNILPSVNSRTGCVLNHDLTTSRVDIKL